MLNRRRLKKLHKLTALIVDMPNICKQRRIQLVDPTHRGLCAEGVEQLKYRTNLPGIVCALKAQLAPAKSQPPRRPATATAPPSRIFPVVVRDSIVPWVSDARSSERLRSSITTFSMPERYAVKTAEPACSCAPKGFARSQ